MTVRTLTLTACASVALACHAQSFTNIYSFPAYNVSSATNAAGANPRDGLIASGGVLYGTTQNGGTFGNGTVFALSTSGNTITVLHTFTSTVTLNSDGAKPTGRLLLLGNTLYGTAPDGGTNGTGVIFSLLTNGTDYTTLFTFSTVALDNNIDESTNNTGSQPNAGLFSYSNVLYGTAISAGLGGAGTAFSIGTNNNTSFKNLHSFDIDDGFHPTAGVVQSGTNLYGATIVGGSAGFGTLFAVSTNGGFFTNIYTFSGSDGYYPYGDLLVDSNNLYGTTVNGGKNGAGTVFRVALSGNPFASLYSFSTLAANNLGAYTNGDGVNPYAGLTLVGSMLYGTSSAGGLFGNGTVFGISLNGQTFINLHNFSALSGTGNTNTDGANPYGALVYANGALYGSTQNGGTNGNGAIFKITLPVPILNITRSGTNAILSWTVSGYTLQAATNVTGIYSNLNNATSPYTNPTTGSEMFFRLQSD